MIELFKEPNIDWMGKAKYFYALSGILLVAGWISIFMNGGLKYSIDFKGGTNVDVRFAQTPNIDKIRGGLTAQGLGNTEIQSVSDIANPNSNEVLIFVEQKNQGDEAGDASKTQVINALNAIYGTANSSKPDFNSATSSALTAFFTQHDPLLLTTNAGDKYQQLSKKILDYRDTTSKGVFDEFRRPCQGGRRHSGRGFRIEDQLCARLVRHSRRRDRRAQSGRRASPPGNLRYPLCFGRHAGIYCLPIRVGLRGSRRPCRVSRRFDHAGLFLACCISRYR